ncbi:unnamed protein product [Protopolystoma xenopodis]|uniref:Uncharacterized protein n=1 Tax=Protopolystoma xenopodis TaxID=117903 RepID=A0A3S5CPY6_9PLAT|nr:unnamed protein product [Protopolystoma xenopodis]
MGLRTSCERSLGKEEIHAANMLTGITLKEKLSATSVVGFNSLLIANAASNASQTGHHTIPAFSISGGAGTTSPGSTIFERKLSPKSLSPPLPLQATFVSGALSQPGNSIKKITLKLFRYIP